MSKTSLPSGNGAAATATITSNHTAKGALEELIKSAMTVAQDKSLGRTLQHFDRIPKLEAELRSKDEQITKLTLQMQQDRIKHQTVKQEALETYETSKDKLKLQLDNTDKTLCGLKDELKSKTVAHEEVTNQQASLQISVRGLKETLEARKTDLARSEDLKSALQRTVDLLKAENGSLQKNLKTHEGRLRRMEADLKHKDDETGSLSKEYNSTKRELLELQSCFVTLRDQDPEPILAKLAKPWAAISKLVWSAFSLDLPDDVYQNKAAWDRLEYPRRWRHSLPLPQSNSQVAKQMRSVVVIATVVRAVDFHIFQPTYFLPPSIELRNLVTHQTFEERQRKGGLRAFLQAMLPQEQASAATQQVKCMCDELIQDIAGILPIQMVTSFKKQLESIVEDICHIWQQVVCLEYAVEPSFDLEPPSDLPWEKIRLEPEQITVAEDAQVTDDAKDKAQSVIFPRFYSVDEDGLYPVNHGVVIVRSQSKLATQEVEQISSGSGLERHDSLLTKYPRPRRASTLNRSVGPPSSAQASAEPASPGKLLNGRK